MQTEKNNTQWTENDSQAFVEDGNIFVPDRARLHQRIVDLIPLPASPVDILDICCGEGLLSCQIAKKSPLFQMHCYDGSPVMLENAKKHLSRLPNKAHFEQFDLLSFEKSSYPARCHAVVSSLAIHHLEDTRKRDLFKFVNALLPANGIFIIVDVIMPLCQAAVHVAAQDWDIAAYKQSVDFTGTLDAYHAFQADKWNIYPHLDDAEYMAYDRPASLYDQLQWLEKAGFSKVDALWLYAGHAIFYGIK